MEHDEQQQRQVSNGSASFEKLPPFSSKYPWFIVENFKEEDDGIDTEFFSTLHDPLIQYQSQIPEFHGKRIRGCFHGWLILSDHPHNVLCSLWNPVTLKIVRLPPLSLKDGIDESIDECLLTAPPEDPDSVILLRRCDESTFVFCQLNRKRKRMRWIEMSYDKQLKKITYNGELVESLTCCNGKIYALNTDGILGPIVIEVEIVVKGSEVIIQLVVFGACPWPDSYHCYNRDNFIKGYGTDLFCISIFYQGDTKKIGNVILFRLDTGSIKWEELECLKKWDVSDMIVEKDGYEDHKDLGITRVMWEEMNDLKDAIFYVDLGRDITIFYTPVVESELGGYIHIRDETDDILYLYHVRDRTIIASSIPSQVVSTTHVSMWEGRLDDNQVEAKCTGTVKQDEVLKHNESRLHNIPFDVLEMIMKYCVGVEYLNFRATCRLCCLAAPLIKWSNELQILHNYSLNSPCLMVISKYREIITFTDVLSGDNYFIKKNFQVLSIVDDRMYCSRYGWLLFESKEFECPVFFNPFTSDVRKLLDFEIGFIKSLCFSAPPNSSNCIVAGFAVYEGQRFIIYSVDGEPSWRVIHLDDDHNFRYSLTFIGRDLYALGQDGEVIAFKDFGKEEVRRIVLSKAPISSCDAMSQYFLMSCDEHLLVVIVGDEFGEVEVFKRNDEADKWEKIDGIGKRTIYIGSTTSICIDAKTPKMENKIYFTQLVWYSLETHTYHTFDGKIMKTCIGGFFGAKSHINCHAWIEPSWCQLT
ncbi:uncharacterized protein [Rutidosis leptorrhynchoides]|uniref:uncharacterized protein n=1 Tax=Rutidosis leptorrhynchoides TaxID=125765 RepID=UPI003A99A0DE